MLWLAFVQDASNYTSAGVETVVIMSLSVELSMDADATIFFLGGTFIETHSIMFYNKFSVN